MKFLAFAAVAGAFVIPDASVVSQLVLTDNKAAAKAVNTVDAVKTSVANAVDAAHSWVSGAFDTDNELNTLADDMDFDALSKDLPIFDPILIGGKAKVSNLTLYQLIASSNYTTQFTALVDEFPAIVALLNTTSAEDAAAVNHTVFVPVDTAFAALPGWNTTTDAAVRESIVRYHIGLGDFPYKVLFATHTVPSLYHEPLLGGAAQRLRVRFEKKLGVRVNFAARVVAANVLASNGVVHAVDTVVVPPTFVGRQLSLVPDHYSTLLLAMNVSGFTAYMHGLTGLNGSTVLAPSNKAFTLLGPEVNAFLFNSARGLKYLHALLRYATVPNATVYSDAFYGPAALAPLPTPPFAGGGGAPGFVERLHYQLPTLLGDATVSVNVTSVPGYSVMLVNNKVRVAVQDGVAKNGVIQEVDRVVFPPPPATVPGSPWVDPPVKTVADLVARLGPYVEDDGDDDEVAVAGAVASAVAPASANEL
ncbi:hypothetical protein SCUCBS95973_002876 [Sporothrix curviconia]|uniref:FAS1 domain-containing protein n=1 Tax=Sporothrix curviconia TaxID=1260050 RepID=A0ABP0BAN1_9PEZI